MNKRIGLYLYLSSLFLALILATACTSTVDTESTPITLPTAPPPQEPRALSASALMAVDWIRNTRASHWSRVGPVPHRLRQVARDPDILRRIHRSERPPRVSSLASTP